MIGGNMRGTVAKKLRKVARLLYINGGMARQAFGGDERTIYRTLKRNYKRGINA
jgi:hypothetical protein